MKTLTKEDIINICNEYGTKSLAELCNIYKIGDKRIKKILKDNNIRIFDSHKKTVSQDTYIEDNKNRFPKIDDEHYIAVFKNDQNIKFNDYLNQSGTLTQYIKKNLNIDIPSLYLRKKYFHENNKQWYEQWFDILSIKNEIKEVKKCPYCNWETTDIENKSGMFLTHLLKEHSINREQHLKEHPEDKEYFTLVNKTLNREFEEDNTKFIKCAICGKKLARIDWRHLAKHGITEEKYKELYGKTTSQEYSDKMSEFALKLNLNLKPTYTSKPQMEIYEFITNNGIICELNNRKILHGMELDIYIPSLKIGIEYNGNFWHTEGMNKKTNKSHLEKTEKCKELGIKLIQIFEDEYFSSKEIVFNKISHLIGIQKSLPKIMGRKCIIKNISSIESKQFLSKYHIQGFVDSTVHKGAFYKNELIAVMSFKICDRKNDDIWELTRFASNYNYICQGIGGKLFSNFIKEYNPSKIKSFADRRWTINEDNNIYTQLGFSFEKYTEPEYRYYNNKVDRYKRFHKFGFRKQILHKKYGLPLTMTESEMTAKLGYKKIWDCGLIKYIWNKKED